MKALTARQALWIARSFVLLVGGTVVSAKLMDRMAVMALPLGLRNQAFIGTDFSSFYGASLLILDGRPASVYDVALHKAAQVCALGPLADYYQFFYPPMFLLAVAPLGLLPYLTSAVVWCLATLAPCVWVLRRWAPPQIDVLAILLFPAVTITIVHGQNAFLTTALFGAAILYLDKRPALAGVFIGLLAIKPHLGLLFPIYLLAMGRWSTILWAVTTVLALALATTLAFGGDVWAGYAGIQESAKLFLETRHVHTGKMQSLFMMARSLGASTAIGYGVQTLAGLGVAALVVVAARRKRADTLAMGALLASGSLLTTPFLLRYDLMLLAIPLIWLVKAGLESGFRPGELAVVALSFMTPMIPPEFAQSTDVLLAPLLNGFLFAVVAQRALTGTSPGLASNHVGGGFPARSAAPRAETSAA
ncbi:glycosyltransferase family 87 protein [Alsobacter sp. KACC 23698]|uniref:Glycosyltransferase family 87 protein n=1 Tax=Alsobacter sp. KACC 23698 TaxID=3149229 RepID=A0AAU7JAF3_9HYPH